MVKVITKTGSWAGNWSNDSGSQVSYLKCTLIAALRSVTMLLVNPTVSHFMVRTFNINQLTGAPGNPYILHTDTSWYGKEITNP